MYDLILSDATIVSSEGRQVADVAIKDGKIAYVGPRPRRRARQTISAIGKFLMPGVIDTGVRFDATGDASTWEDESRAAVSGGVTTVIALPDTGPLLQDRKALKARAKQLKNRSWVHFGFWGGANKGNLKEMRMAAEEGLTVGTLAYIGDYGGLGIEMDALSDVFDIEGVVGLHLNGSGADGKADEVVSKAIDMARSKATTKTFHLMHLSTAEELHVLDPVRGDLPVTAGVTPHHLFLSEDQLKDHVGANPPVRPEHDRKTLWTAIKRGRLDVLASDHSPDTNSGLPGAELMFPLLLSAVKYGRLSLEGLVAICCERPSAIFGLPHKGRIAVGNDADLVLFSEGELGRVTSADLLSKAGWSPYIDREAAPKPELVIVAGRVVAQRGVMLTNSPEGQLLQRSAPLATA